MAKKKILFKSKELRDTISVAALLRELADKLEEGEIVLRRGEEEVAVSIGESVAFKVKVKEKQKRRGIRRKLSLVMTWMESRAASGRVTVG